ncbi:MAG: acryloyl-CoA reductase, partial [Gammaproteobacteria bacterium]|nr:acryloyl-CoA reductase [Gammaproteobacteria bacterium]
LSGHVVSSGDKRLKEGDAVVVCGAGLSETHDGGYAEYARLPAEFIVKLPQGLSVFQAMAIGTAGFTAAFAVQRMEENHQSPQLGSIAVTGATGGVGSIAIDILSARGYDVVALTGKIEQDEYLRNLGASRILSRHDLDMGSRPLEKIQWGGAVDNVGGDVLSWLTRTVAPGGNIASIGLVGGVKLETTVMPFILRGVSLLGINSVLLSPEVRDAVWQRLADDLRPRHLERIATREIPFAELPEVFDAYIAGEVVGRAVVKIEG